MSKTTLTTQQALGSGVVIEAVQSMTGAESIAWGVPVCPPKAMCRKPWPKPIPR
jgi:hypothetical protein